VEDGQGVSDCLAPVVVDVSRTLRPQTSRSLRTNYTTE
jgi:hypothetical protein